MNANELRGVVRDAQGFALPGARISLYKAAGPGAFDTSTSDGQGRFRFAGVESGDYEVEAYSPGFDRHSVAVTLRDEGVEVELTLALAALHEGIVVTASRQEQDTATLPLPTSLVSDERLRETMPTNLAQALFDIPGVTWVNAGSFRGRPVIRGLDSNRILVMVDGERLNNNRTATNQGGIETALVDVSDIRQVEVVRGPGSVLYGSDAFGGVVNILTHGALPRDRFGVGARLGATTMPNNDGRRAHAELSAGGRRFSVRGRGAVGAVNDYRAPGSRTVYFSGSDENSALGEARIYPSGSQSAWFKYLHRGGYNFGLPSLDPNPAFLAEFPFSKLNKFSGGYQKSFASRALASFRASVYSQRQHRSFFNRVQTGPQTQLLSDTVTDVESVGFDIQASSAPTPSHVLTYGATYYRDENRDFRLQTMVGAGPAPVVLDAAPSVPNSTFSGTGLFFQDQFEPFSRLRVTAGLRADRFDLNVLPTPNFDPGVAASIGTGRTDNAIGGNLGASFDIGSGWMLSGNVGRAFRAPNLFERFFFGRGSVGGFVVPNPGLRPETSIQFDTGLHFRRGPVKTSAHYFRNRLDSLIASAPGTFNGSSTLGGQPVSQNVNIDEARIQGVESSSEVGGNAAGARWTLSLGAAWQRGENLGTNGPLPLIAPFVGSGRLRWAPHRTRFWSELATTVVPSSQRAPAGFIPIRGYSLFNWRAGYSVVPRESSLGAALPPGVSSLSLYAGLENLGNRVYFGLFENVPQPGRDFRFGIELGFDSNAK